LGVKDNTTFNLTVSQLIFSGEYLVGLQASRVYKELSEQNLVVSELKTKESVASSYYVVLVIDENIAILKESRNLVAKTLADISKMNEAGYTEDTDVDQMKINLSNLETLILSLEGQRKISIKLLKLQIGMDIQQPVKLTDSIQGIISADNLEYLSDPEYVLQSSPTYKLLEVQENLMALSVKREKSKYLPTIAGFYRHQQLMNEPDLNFSPKDIIGVSLSIPIITSGSRISKIKQAKLDLEKTQLNKVQAGEGLILEFETALNAYQIAYKNYLTNKESMDLSAKIYKKNNIKYTEGILSSLDLTQSQDQLLTAQRNYYQSVATFLNAKVALDRILSK
jgi:outer membrane protein TolC